MEKTAKNVQVDMKLSDMMVQYVPRTQALVGQWEDLVINTSAGG